MKRFSQFTSLAIIVLTLSSLWSCKQDESYIVTTFGFQDIPLDNESYWNGSDGSGRQTFGTVTFNNFYESNDWGGYWEGFAYSNITDTETSGYENQYSAYIDGGGNANNIYAVAYVSGESATIAMPYEVEPLAIKVTNSTYAYYTMLNGNMFAAAFDEGDWFKLTIRGYDSNDNEVGYVDFYLADFRSTESYIVDDWTTVSLASLKNAAKLVLQLSSSDTSEWGMNTPAYVCIDNLSIKFPL
ncbi:MAG: PEP-CTERM sorting domain-containing protein [Bacteroidetes bacterium HGW-Bacteroidetes-15]|nr:MAG: PEP-CTERM sorting domain-containing protein [Bacteroidetes bacterium HGW-Bacteroidetes-15]